MAQKDIELLAPVGSFEALSASINSGANSVYFGVGSLNMRSKSSFNFNLNDIRKVSSICKKNNIKCYLALNSVMYDQDKTLVKKIIKKSLDNNIDALIVSDPSILNYTQNLPIDIHLSTQLNISNLEGVKFWSKYANIMVLARELSLKQIKYITNQIDKQNILGKSDKKIRIEVFIHGALCMSISGKCFLSTHLHNTSANRGECFQICRKPFNIIDDQGLELTLDNPYILSPKDLCTLPIIKEILNSNVSVLKIEGRGRSPEYVSNVVRAYRKAIDLCTVNKLSTSTINELMLDLQDVYNRGFWTGHYLGENNSSWNTNVGGSKSNSYKVYVGRIVKYFKKAQVAEFIIEAGKLAEGDDILIIGPTTGAEKIITNEIYLNENKVEIAEKGSGFTFKVPFIVRPSDKIYKINKRVSSSNQ